MLKIILSAILLLNSYFQCTRPNLQQTNPPVIDQQNPPVALVNNQNGGAGKIQVALLLDTSNSMDGLIDQAKAQLWKMVNKLAGAKKNDQNAQLEIALFEYGNNGLNAETGYIRLVQPLGGDLDGLSEKLFELRTNGGEEYCGWAIKSAQDLLPWSQDAGMKIIIIAGNEPFNQGPVNFRRSCATALEKGIIINTIHCGDYQSGEKTFWKEGATIGNGKYLNIDTDQKVVQIATPYDAEILRLNERLNNTYLGYGSLGVARKERQVVQDQNAAEYGSANVAQRAAAKSKASYSNADWDVVDAAKNDKDFAKKVPAEDLPAQLRGKPAPEIEKEIARLSAERESIRKELAELEVKMQSYVEAEQKKGALTQTLDNVLIEAIVEQGQAHGFVFGK